MKRNRRNQSRQKLVVATYLVDRARGGPEEGGWWFNYGHLIAINGTFFRQDSAETHRATVQARLDKTDNLGRRPIESVLSEGLYEAIVWDGKAPKRFPPTRPRYE